MLVLAGKRVFNFFGVLSEKSCKLKMFNFNLMCWWSRSNFSSCGLEMEIRVRVRVKKGGALRRRRS